ncbi:metallophosphoesterase family protein [Kordiimonas aestuarii]|uniref:metallophosphoesterase family protein n=1 Tax=Kordiimonas aestuarii TaxID=1005925 RepID=UPI0021D123E3|nr:metallophosphoesterase [Kordiimonas aestuarii]
MVKTLVDRRGFLKATTGAFIGTTLPLTNVRLAFAGEREDFTFAYISDSHIQHIKGNKFVRNWDRGLIRAVAECNMLEPKPDFVFYGGDIAQLAKPEEIDHGLELLSALRYDTHYVMGEHDYYLDLGEYWSKLLGDQWYSFDHKGVHFVVLNSILTDHDWTYNRWKDGEERMSVMAGLDDPRGSPFMVGEEQRKWLAKDLKKVDKKKPVVVLSHSPLQKIFKNWNFWTDDAEEVQALLHKFDKVSVLYGHVHQIQYNQIGNISFYSAMATAWPWPYPETYAQAPSHLPELTVPMNRADPFFERDATGWQFIDVWSGRSNVTYRLPENSERTVAYNKEKGHPEDTEYAARNIPPQNHY